MKVLSLFFTLIFIGSTALAFVWGAFTFMQCNHPIDLSVLDRTANAKATVVFDRQGKEIARFAADKRDSVSYEKFPAHLINAFLAAEDWQFFSHHGISYKGIIRSLLVNISHGRAVQGASTITQQLIKMVMLDSRKTIKRKLKEQVYALIVESQYSKEYILQMYLNNVFFGCGIYGVQAAAQRFWGKNIEDISVDEAAALAGIVRRPAFYCPLSHALICEQRRNVVLRLMMQRGVISSSEYASALAIPLTTITATEAPHLLHIREMVRGFIEKKFGKQQVYSGGLTIQATFDLTLQERAWYEFQKKCTQLTRDRGIPIDGGLISIECKTGAIRALVGGVDFSYSQFNRATQARRQMGSTFKPLIYAAAIGKGKTFAHTEIDEPFELEVNGSVWRPHNYDNTFSGRMTLAYALSHSSNIVTVKTLLDVGIQNIVDLAQRCHLSGPIYPYPSLALGCIDATLLETTAVFNIFANNGMYSKPYFISWVKDFHGKKIWRHSEKKELIMPSIVADQVAKVLKLGVQRVKKMFGDSWVKCEVIGKTGTTNDWRTCWFLGSTPEITTGIYIGCDDNRSLGNNMFPVHTALPIWAAYHASIPIKERCFEFDPHLSDVRINAFTGMQTDVRDPEGLIIGVPQ